MGDSSYPSLSYQGATVILMEIPQHLDHRFKVSMPQGGH